MTQPSELLPPPTKLVHGFLDAYERAITALKLRQAPPGLIYHYCDANALLNIFQTRHVWATDTNYLNDKEELVSLFKNVQRHLQSICPETDDFLGEQFAAVADGAPRFRACLIGMSTCVACFSKDGDVLSQWRAYGADGMGFAIGFDPQDLRVLTNESGATLKRMIYGGREEEDIVSEYFTQIAEALAPYQQSIHTYGWPDMGFEEWTQLRIGEFLHEFSFECKHPAFHEEREWRIIAGKSELCYRASVNRLVPYRLLNMTSIETEERMPIREIVIGPCAHPMESERTLTYIADSHGYGHSGIGFRRSTAPYRK